MKSQIEIENRLRKLKTRYLRKHIQKTQERCPKNCKHAVEFSDDSDLRTRHKNQVVRKSKFGSSVNNVTLVVFNDQNQVHLCVHGCSSSVWNGDAVCFDDVPKSCSKFEPKIEESIVAMQFDTLLADDEYVMEHMKDVATLQWVLDVRISMWKLNWFERIIMFFFSFFRKREKLVEAPNLIDLPKDIWEDADNKNI